MSAVEEAASKEKTSFGLKGKNIFRPRYGLTTPGRYRRGARSARGVLRFYSKITFSKHLGSLGCSEFLLYEFPFLYELVTQFSTRRLPNRERSHVVRGVAEVLGESRLKSARPGGVDA